MKKFALSLVLSSILVPTAYSSDIASQQLIEESRQISMGFGKSLKGELQTALKAGGPKIGIQTCNVKAPELARQSGDKAGVELSRTSLKLRNPKNAPDDWETAVLQQFEERKANGESPKQMEYSEVVDHNGEKVFRYMKAIIIAEPCLKCHGNNVKQPIAEELNRLYPDDKARGYNLGDIRGAFTLQKKIASN